LLAPKLRNKSIITEDEKYVSEDLVTSIYYKMKYYTIL